MTKLNRSWAVLTLLIGLLGVSSVALAEHDDNHPEDTEFSFAYDAIDHFLAINISDNDTSWVCDFDGPEGEEPPTLTGEYDDLDDDGKATILSLKDDEENDWEFEARDGDEVNQDVYPVEEGTTPYTAEGPCIVNGIVVAGPNGQINHGQFMKAAKSLFDIKGHGCIVRHLAKSDIGKDDTQLKTGDVEDTWMFDADGDGAVLSFTTFETDCKRGKGKDKSEAALAKNANKVRGKSADAPGKNK